MKVAELRRHLPGGRLVPAACFVALLHFGQEVLEPLALAAILSLAIAPLVRRIQRIGLPRRVATVASVVLAGVVLLAIAATLAFQLAAAASELPRYRAGMLTKIEQVRDLAVRPLEQWRRELGIAAPQQAAREAPAGSAVPSAIAPGADPAVTPADLQSMPRLLGFAGRALAECGIVLVLLVFILLDLDVLRDRLLTLAGRTELASTLQALGDATDGVSRFFLSQCIVNLCLGLFVAAALWLIGIPHAPLFGALAGVLRFLPYVGSLTAGVVVAVFAAAVDPGWSLVIGSVLVLAAAELVVFNAVEPHVYGHTSGLAPVSIIISALFWGAVWGPVGLVVATPLTLCLVVAGRYVPALEPITIFFGDSPGITQGQRLYHRALAGELRDIQEDARSFLARRGFAAYCDHILLPAMALAGADYRAGRLQERQLQSMRETVVALVESVAGGNAAPRAARKRVGPTLVEANVGAHLRKVREARLGRWQGPSDARCVVLCASLGAERDEFEAELLVRALSAAGLEARSASLPQHPDDPQDTVSPDRVSTVFVGCPESSSLAEWRSACRELRSRLPHALFATVRLPTDADVPGEAAVHDEVDLVLRSFAEAVTFVQAGAESPASPGHRPLPRSTNS